MSNGNSSKSGTAIETSTDASANADVPLLVLTLATENSQLKEEQARQKRLIEQSKKELRNLSNQLQGVEASFTESKTNFIEILGIFVALFTFISVDIQLFRANISFLSIIGFTLITLGGLLFFVTTLRLALHWEKKIVLRLPEAIFLLISLGLVAVGAWFAYLDAQHVLVTKTEVASSTSALSDKIDAQSVQLEDLKKCLLAGKWAQCLK